MSIEKLKIGVDIRTLMDRYYSGVSEYTFNLLTAILRQDQESEFRLFYNSFSDLSRRLPDFSDDRTKIYNPGYPNKIFNYFLQKILGQPKLDRLLGGVDVFFSPHFNFTTLSEAPKKILTIHDLSFLRYPEYFNWRKNIWHRLVNIKKLIKRFDVLVAVSKNTKNDLVELLDVPEKKIRVIYSGLDKNYQPLNPEILINEFKAVILKYNLPTKFFLYLGNIEPRKNIVGAIKAFDLFKSQLGVEDYELVIAGSSGWRVKEVFSAARLSKNKEQIKFLGYVAKDDKPYLYNLCSLFIYPSFYEGFGFPPLEAMACGAAVITSDVSSLPEIVGQGALTINPDDHEALAAAINEIINNQGLKDALKSTALTQAAKFNWEKTAAEYLTLFKEV